MHGTLITKKVMLMSKALSNRLLRIERLHGSGEFVIGIREPNAYKGVKVNGSLMSEKQFKLFADSLPDPTELWVVSIIENGIGE